MTTFPKPLPIQPPATPPPGLAADVVTSGPPIHPEQRIKLYSSQEWEQFVHEWVDSLRDEYELVERCGGAGDMGRDVIGTVKGGDGAWDNYQCKHYTDSLKPTDVWAELGKLAYYTKRGDYSYPRRYYFIAPQGAGTKLSNLLKKPDKLRSQLLSQWDTYCRNGITKTEDVECDAPMIEHINSLDFSIFQATPVMRIIDAHSNTKWFVARFGGGLPPRPDPLAPPVVPGDNESVFVSELRRAYADHLKLGMQDLDATLNENADLCAHFKDARIEFYSAEGLRTFSRDTLARDEFADLQDEVHSGIRDDLRGEYADGYRRVLAVVKTARLLPLTSHPLVSRIHIRDRGGICHQLVNDKRFLWVK